MKRRVVVTGLGIVSPVGIGLAASWDSIVHGRSGIARVTRIDPEAYASQIAGEVKGFDVGQYLPVKEARKMELFIHYGLAASMEAMEDSGLKITPEIAERVGVSIGSGIGGLPGIESEHSVVTENGPRRISPFFIPRCIVNMVSGHVSILYGAKGPNIAMATACSTATHSIGDAARLIEYGDADVMIAGGAEAAISPLGLGGFSAARALSTRNDAPEKASRPWDEGRDGFVLAEGAGILVLEELEFAQRRGAKIYAEVVGYGMSADAYHMTQPASGGEGAARCMQVALRNAGLPADAVDYINAHGTSTPLGDLAETEAVKAVFGEHSKRLAMSSTKSMTGHLLGAAGGIEAVFTTLAIHNGILPPTINLEQPSAGCDLDYVANVARQQSIEVALSNSFGFGGTNSTLVFRKFHD
ncbi:beta-ketoacyl-ACP synthase II [Acidithiobacillus sp. CV18-2]|uniref:3-oxoacyl-[acyl-carrier-protein] synthase 2 n=1 Tax=Igneacidithiobacillus copahuensis TaxID=2724909 RepID=A0AAE2YPM9_9PROT|nr:beta-ketoacyl-ACP synthase II [Igneacidithiobacillus copahuensis]MBU2755681.1 beta-ketoacyl-ACP synthase II [Acidithiobacillus sp. CV18-3]MBU2758251.1 beta-ketoacyl-ACP synthase II [Acidithiobacillus sp. BN09-2]MBU2777509.1 beta-ketoacyl-ACP synthase II [Acidithiobacillus sp. CV18-2]MBU2796823.1 beta-ketoacyl-ACP synthase II [Acidithiobacillus sp. VAN18-2]MBU2800433.1 beta-ketoacyl-ACP synthase II [Acidithiobacillus sp. VAN18-4]UTV80223.1 beta-ketoacyl-ACP synthase II [Acidithiobacillus sp